MTNLSINFHHITFSHDRASQPLFRHLSLHIGRGWTGVVGANGVGKSTLLKLATGDLTPQQGTVSIPDHAIYCPQRTDEIPADFDRLLQSMEGDACGIRGRLGVEKDWIQRWPTLSQGERKRAQIAVALWQRPSVLALDEPTNHLDIAAQSLLFKSLETFQGIGMLVSHHRDFLDDLCRCCVFVNPPQVILRPGNYTQGSLQAKQEADTAARRRQQAKQAFSKLKREAHRRRTAASQADHKRSKGKTAPRDHDAKAKIDLARVTGKDGAAGKRLNQLKGRFDQARRKMEGTKVEKSYSMGIWMPGSLSSRNTLFQVKAGSLVLGKNRRLFFPDLFMKPDDRVAITGVNGCGKSTLVTHIRGALNVDTKGVVYLPQEIDLQASSAIMAEARNLSRDQLGAMMTVVSRLGSRPHRLLESLEPSPGETRKLLLAMGIVKRPHLIIMDEPTNHLDLPSIECLEEALKECPCGLLLVSHDKRFLNALTLRQWRISGDKSRKGDYRLECL